MKTFEKEAVANEFGRFVREARERRGMTQYEIAEQLGITRSYYTMIEAGNRDIYFSLAMNICKILNLDINEFMKRLK